MLSEVLVDTELPKLQKAPSEETTIMVGCVPIQIPSQLDSMLHKAAGGDHSFHTQLTFLHLIIPNLFDTNIVTCVQLIASSVAQKAPIIRTNHTVYFVHFFELKASVCVHKRLNKLGLLIMWHASKSIWQQRFVCSAQLKLYSGWCVSRAATDLSQIWHLVHALSIFKYILRTN